MSADLAGEATANRGDVVVLQPHGGALRPFQPGNRANPSGRSKSPAALRTRILRETKTGAEVVTYLLDAMRHSRSGKERIDAATLLLAYGFGKPVQPTELSGTDGGPIEHTLSITAQAIDYRASVRGLAPSGPEDGPP